MVSWVEEEKTLVVCSEQGASIKLKCKGGGVVVECSQMMESSPSREEVAKTKRSRGESMMI